MISRLPRELDLAHTQMIATPNHPQNHKLAGYYIADWLSTFHMIPPVLPDLAQPRMSQRRLLLNCSMAPPIASKIWANNCWCPGGVLFKAKCSNSYQATGYLGVFWCILRVREPTSDKKSIYGDKNQKQNYDKFHRQNLCVVWILHGFPMDCLLWNGCPNLL